MRRIRALKKLQLESTQLEAQFYTEVQELEAKYLALNQPLFEKRRDIITGSHEPTDEEAHWSGDEDNDDEETPVEEEGEAKKTEGAANGTSGGASSKDGESVHRHMVGDFGASIICDEGSRGIGLVE